jgi:uncharacterized protein YndB with AHSA1/START domain
MLAAPDNSAEIADSIMSNLRQTVSFFSCRSTSGTTTNWKEREPGTCDHVGGGIAMNIGQPIEARVTRVFSASPPRVFASWLDSTTARKWLFARTGEIVCAEIDGRAEGWFYIVERRNGENVEYVGEYLEVIQPHRLVFMLLAEKYSLNFERVTVLFKRRGTGCEVSLTHETKPELAEQVRRDWTQLFDRLAALIKHF